jgi:hypothetical protein
VAARLRQPVVALTSGAVLVLAVLAIVGWRAHWAGDLTASDRSSPSPPAAISPAHPVLPPTSAASAAGSAAPAAASVPAASVPAASVPVAPVPAASAPAGSSPAAPASPALAGPAATVEAYFAAITSRDYALAWTLGGLNSGQTYSQFVAGLADTTSDTISGVSESGPAVTAILAARQADGSVKYFHGVYTVTGDVITTFHVLPGA